MKTRLLVLLTFVCACQAGERIKVHPLTKRIAEENRLRSFQLQLLTYCDEALSFPVWVYPGEEPGNRIRVWDDACFKSKRSLGRFDSEDCWRVPTDAEREKISEFAWKL